ncbi:DUF4177 domain-containing protein [Salinibius halmophilus]|uniref:DUF4177 domain-containing protein n=1 Tax=Salinibius halmophilus TaxID=1853216 RepID=UPI000E672266|nr:DUF4177 domain-containing protein [Salinibius halmophilus]
MLKQKVIEFGKRNFWSSKLDIEALNEKISQLNADGWKVVSITPNSALGGGVVSYTIFVELEY